MTTTSADLKRKVAVLTHLAQISSVLNSSISLDDLLGRIMDTAAEITDSESASVLLWDERASELRIAATTTDSTLNLIGRLVPLEGSIAGSIMQENRAVMVEDTRDDPRHYSKMDTENKFQTRSLLGVPMASKERLIGVLETINKKTPPWTEDDQESLMILAAQAAVAIEQAQLVAALQKANTELSQLDKLKNDFIAIASHELRTPLAIILGYASFLQDPSFGEASDLAGKVLASALQLRRIIEDLTNLRYLKAGQADLRMDLMPLADLIAECRHDIQTLAEAQRHILDFKEIPRHWMVNVDYIKISMAITNVLSNAVRFTPAGGRITVHAQQRDNGEVWITFADTGIGIPEASLERVFEEFYQVEDHMTRTHNGLGIGLSIARALVIAHGGRLFAASPGIGQGAVFTLCLPLAQA